MKFGQKGQCMSCGKTLSIKLLRYNGPRMSPRSMFQVKRAKFLICRPCELIKKNRMEDMARRPIFTADCETDPFAEGRENLKPFIWGLYNPKEGFKSWRKTDEFIKYVKSKKIICYIHNGGKFDFHFFLHHIPVFEPLLVISGRLVRFRIGLCEFRDSVSILPIALAQYQKTKIDYTKFEADVREKHMREITDYLRDDCKFLHEIVSQFIGDFGLNITLASTALKQLVKICGLKKPKTSYTYYRELQPYYYGGRTEVFKGGRIKGPIHTADINSAYPFAMLHNHPWGTDLCRFSDDDPEIIPQRFYRFTAISKGAFPFRMKDGRLSFPNDNEIREYCVTGWELIAALELGLCKIIEHIEHLFVTELASFEKFVNHFYEQKQQSPKGSPPYIFAKLMLNSAYGKTAANPCGEIDEEGVQHGGYWNYQYAPAMYSLDLLEDGFRVFETPNSDKVLIASELEEDEKRFFNVATGASITGFVRAYLLRAIAQTKGVLYCDTDCLYFTGATGVAFGQALGQWDDEGSYHSAYIAGKKLYALQKGKKPNKKKDKVRSKGAKLSLDEIKKVASGQEILWRSIIPQFSLKKGIRIIPKKIVATCPID